MVRIIDHNSRIEYHNVYDIRISIYHPNIDPHDITKIMWMNPDFAWKAGSDTRIPDGKKLQRRARESYWNFSSELFYDRLFFDRLDHYICKIEEKHDLLQSIMKGSGRLLITVEIGGKSNIGDIMSVSLAERVVKLGVEVGIEIFPDLGR